MQLNVHLLASKSKIVQLGGPPLFILATQWFYFNNARCRNFSDSAFIVELQSQALPDLFYPCPRQLFLLGWTRSSFKNEGKKGAPSKLKCSWLGELPVWGRRLNTSRLWGPDLRSIASWVDQLEGEKKSGICSCFPYFNVWGKCEVGVKLLPDQIQDTSVHVQKR